MSRLAHEIKTRLRPRRLSVSASTTGWDQTVDLLIVGTGAGAMAAAITTHDRGGTALLIEKTSLYGGSSAMSGGSLWIPNNHLMAAAGVDDSYDDALTYLKHITRGAVPEEKLRRYVETAPRMLTLHERANASPHAVDADLHRLLSRGAGRKARAAARSSPSTSTRACSARSSSTCASRPCRSW